MPLKNAAQVSREVKRQLSLAKLPSYTVRTSYVQLSKRSPAGKLFGWHTTVQGLDAESIEVVELVMGNLPGLIDIKRFDSFLSITLEDQS